MEEAIADTVDGGENPVNASEPVVDHRPAVSGLKRPFGNVIPMEATFMVLLCKLTI